MSGESCSFSETMRPTWRLQFLAALNEHVRGECPKRIRLAEDAIFDCIDAMDASRATIEDLDERWAMSSALANLRSLQFEVIEAYASATPVDVKTA